MTTKVTASVSSDDIRRAYYETAGYSMWISELQVSPLQLIVEDDATGKHYRVPIELSGDSFTLGEAVEVAVQFVDASSPAAAAAARSRQQGLVWASRDVSRQGIEPVRPPTPSPADVARRIHKAPVANRAHGPTPDQKGGSMTDLAKLREGLGLSAELSDEQVQAALAAAGITTQPDPQPDPVDPPPAPTPDPDPALPPRVPQPSAAGAVMLDPATLSALQAQARRGDEAFRRLRENECEQVLDGAIKAGKFPPARREHYQKLWAADPDGTKQIIEGLAANVIPVSASGYPGVGDETEVDLVYGAMYPTVKAGGGRG